MIRLFSVVVFCVVSLVANGQGQKQDYADVRAFELEVGAGINKGIGSGIAAINGGLFLELRHNIPDTPFDVGIQGSLNQFDRDNLVIEGRSGSSVHIMPRLAVVYGDYNLRKWRRVSLFGGVGLGYANIFTQTHVPGYLVYNSSHEKFLAFSPRIGAEFFNRARLTLDCKIVSKNYSFLWASLGFVFGGGYR
ncbi:MAG: hypothetical protein LBV38_00770 [Alistipes sp.]|jgi:hypothetical protein|nr:hypothetical protein [Alistipes sp.]